MTGFSARFAVSIAAIVAVLGLVYLIESSSGYTSRRQYIQTGVALFVVLLLPISLAIWWWRGPSLRRRISAFLASVTTCIFFFVGAGLLAAPLTSDLRAMEAALWMLVAGALIGAFMGPVVAIAVLRGWPSELESSEPGRGVTAHRD
jgi:cytochrome bd-type quinol oxidase subunit 2